MYTLLKMSLDLINQFFKQLSPNSKINIVLGNESADLDSVASSLGLARLLSIKDVYNFNFKHQDETLFFDYSLKIYTFQSLMSFQANFA